MRELTYYPQRTDTDCLLTGLECLLQQPREQMRQDLLSYYPGGYLSYRAVHDVLSTHSIPHYVILRDFTPHLWRETGPMVLGIRMKGHPLGGPLHCVYWDGAWAWEPYTKTFMEEDMREMKVAYAIVSHSHLLRNRDVGSLDWFTRWDENIKRRTPEDHKVYEEAERLGKLEWLEVVG